MIRIWSVSADVSAVGNVNREQRWGGRSPLKCGGGEGLTGRGHSNPKGDGGGGEETAKETDKEKLGRREENREEGCPGSPMKKVFPWERKVPYIQRC